MTRKIQVLDKNIAELIAAGEVVENPASVVKELVENAIDAGSKFIQVEIENGGVSKIKVTDDGIGIAKEDVETAFLRHATSKIKSEADLSAILTLGFRGEALAAIAAVSKLKIVTRPEAQIAGVRLELKAGDREYCDDEGCSQGTSITVSELFFNFPARMKFLKRDHLEAAAVGIWMERFALSNPEVSFKFIKDGALKLLTPGDGELLSGICEVMGKDVAKAVLPVFLVQDSLNLEGYVGDPTHTKASRTTQFFFVNGRYIRSPLLIAALEEAYKNKIAVGRHPICVLKISVPGSFVDVNVHPAKISVKFADEKRLYNLIYNGVISAVTRALQPQISRDVNELFKDINKNVPEFRAPESTEIRKYKEIEMLPVAFKERIDEILNREPKAVGSELSSGTLKEEKGENVYGNLLFKGEVLRTYIICESGDDVVLVDKHALHENLIFERLKEKKQKGFMQVLMAPHIVTLGWQEYDVAISNKELFLSLGFEIDDFGDSSIIVRTLPIEMLDADIDVTIFEIIRNLAVGKNSILPQQQERLLYMIACKAAMKAKDKSNELELQGLIEELNKKQGFVCCPHGRPVCCVLKRKEIEKWFRR
ncbi:MAG: DNA mismatch repair endonuclease MutL [Oscillospiraceae bacterium]|jgi:DNA mismatch repair protein MutL|nr:DNA mismatch repair endonuclease MutL [Oscillospiraceae bacterium]